MSDATGVSTSRAGTMRRIERLSGGRPKPPGLLRATVLSMLTTRVGALRGWRLTGLVSVVALPVLIQLAFVAWGEGRGTGFDALVTQINRAYLWIVVPLITVFLGTSSLGDEWDSGTSSYVLGMPVPRLAIATGRLLASVWRALILVLPSLFVVALLCFLPHEGALDYYTSKLIWLMTSVLLTTLVYSAIFLTFGLALRFSVLVALIFWFVFDFLLAKLPAAVAILSPAFHVRNIAWQVGQVEDLHTWRWDLPGGLEPIAPWVSVVALVVWHAVTLIVTAVMLRAKESRGSTVQSTGTDGAGA